MFDSIFQNHSHSIQVKYGILIAFPINPLLTPTLPKTEQERIEHNQALPNKAPIAPSVARKIASACTPPAILPPVVEV
jgi:hypothetical protein